jgi:chitin synthase
MHSLTLMMLVFNLFGILLSILTMAELFI